MKKFLAGTLLLFSLAVMFALGLDSPRPASGQNVSNPWPPSFSQVIGTASPAQIGEITNSQSGLSMTSVGSQVVIIVTDSTLTQHRVGVYAYISSQGTGCTTQPTWSSYITWTGPGSTGESFSGNVLSTSSADNYSQISAFVTNHSGSNLTGGVNITTAAVGCTPLVSTYMEALP